MGCDERTRHCLQDLPPENIQLQFNLEKTNRQILIGGNVIKYLTNAAPNCKVIKSEAKQGTSEKLSYSIRLEGGKKDNYNVVWCHGWDSRPEKGVRPWKSEPNQLAQCTNVNS